ncbi:hypothetical protein [Dyella acidiphila]|uniref:Glucosyl transferase GtrII n=1 Tax=Dyella acidiphila TaxID=2775866 RepID=A0ABR9G551_9GAMM|nr:hypothetical protein [Dyella acidiphila]MBE1159173.1 hypothetical protein [Dyella acidiphila]
MHRGHPSQPATAASVTRDISAFWLIAMGVLAGVVFPLTSLLAAKQNADGILPALMSTQKLTWYYWDQDRFLNLLPALAWPIPDVEWNLRLQVFLRAFFSFLAPLGILYFFSQSRRLLIPAVALANCIMGLSFAWPALFNLYVECNPFGTSMTLLALALFTLRRGEGRIGWLLLSVLIGTVAYATNIALLAMSLPLIGLSWVTGTLPRKQAFTFLLINIASIVLAYLHSKHFGSGLTPINELAISWEAIKAGYQSVAANVSTAALLVLSVCAMAWGIYAKAPHRYAIVLLVLGSAALVGVLSCSIWPQINTYHIRYYIVFLIAIVAADSYLIVHGLLSLRKLPIPVLPVAAGLLCVEIFIGLHGFSSNYSKLVDNMWLPRSQAVAQTAHAQHAQLIIGDYWEAWPAAFEANALFPQWKNRYAQTYGASWRAAILSARIQRIAGQHGIRALCMKNDLAFCQSMTTMAMHVQATIVPGTVQDITVAGVPMLLMNVTLASFDSLRTTPTTH